MFESTTYRLLRKTFTLLALCGCLIFVSYSDLIQTASADELDDFYNCDNDFDTDFEDCVDDYYECMSSAQTPQEENQCELSYSSCGGTAVNNYSSCISDVSLEPYICSTRHQAANACASTYNACLAINPIPEEAFELCGVPYMECVDATEIWECQ